MSLTASVCIDALSCSAMNMFMVSVSSYRLMSCRSTGPIAQALQICSMVHPMEMLHGPSHDGRRLAPHGSAGGIARGLRMAQQTALAASAAADSIIRSRPHQPYSALMDCRACQDFVWPQQVLSEQVLLSCISGRVINTWGYKLAWLWRRDGPISCPGPAASYKAGCEIGRAG